jgi:hypothetical protein
VLAIKKEADKTPGPAKERKKRAAPIEFDWDTPIVLATILEAGKTTINLAKTSYHKFSHVLPEKDYNFTLDRMTSLFTRPKFKIRFQKRDGTARKEVKEAVAVQEDTPAVAVDGVHVDQDAQFWAERQDDEPIFEQAQEPGLISGN